MLCFIFTGAFCSFLIIIDLFLLFRFVLFCFCYTSDPHRRAEVAAVLISEIAFIPWFTAATRYWGNHFMGLGYWGIECPSKQQLIDSYSTVLQSPVATDAQWKEERCLWQGHCKCQEWERGGLSLQARAFTTSKKWDGSWITTSVKSKTWSIRHPQTYNKSPRWQIEFKLCIFQVNHVRPLTSK